MSDGITHTEALELLTKAVQCNGDPEMAHGMADTALCEFLIGLGFADVVALYDEVAKWYA